jgi:hypothetical protein
MFEGVEGYHFWDDAFGNIIFSLTEIPIDKVLLDYGSEIRESYRMSGAPGSWAGDLGSASATRRQEHLGIPTFVWTVRLDTRERGRSEIVA